MPLQRVAIGVGWWLWSRLEKLNRAESLEFLVLVSFHILVGGLLRDLLVVLLHRRQVLAGLGEHWGLSSQRLQHLSGPGEPITRLADADVEAELPDPQVPHGVLGLILSSLNHLDLSLVEVNQAIKAWSLPDSP